MAANSSSSEDVELEDIGALRGTQIHEQDRSADHPIVVQEEQDAGLTNAQRQVSSLQDVSAETADSTSWWQRPINTLKTAIIYFVAMMGLTLLASFYLEGEEEGSDQGRREQTSQILPASQLPGPASTPSSQQAHHLESASLSGNPSVNLKNLRVRVFRFARFTCSRYGPHSLYALCVSTIFRAGVPSRQHAQACVARQGEDEFVGNADMYGLGVRLGLYLQWIAATLAIRFVPSARRYVLSSCLFSQFGMMVALFLLILPGTCTFTAEVSIILQFLWGGSAIVLVPSSSRRTTYNPKSKYLSLDLLTAVMGFAVFIFTSWFHFRLFFGNEQVFAGTPGGTHTFWLGPLDPSAEPFVRKMQVFWIVVRSFELIDLCRNQPRVFILSCFLDWNWWASATMASGALANMLQGIVSTMVLFISANEMMIGGFSEDFDKTGLSKIELAICSISQSVRSIVRDWLVPLASRSTLRQNG